MFPKVKAEGNIEGQGETKLTVSLWGQSLNVLLYLPIKKTTTMNCSVSVMVKKKMRLTWLDTSLPWFQGAQSDHVQVKSSSCLFP